MKKKEREELDKLLFEYYSREENRKIPKSASETIKNAMKNHVKKEDKKK